MRIAVYSAKPYDRAAFDAANHDGRHQIRYVDARLDATTAALAAGMEAVCLFVGDRADAAVLAALHG